MIVLAQSAPEVAEVRELFAEYAQALGFSLCFQGFAEELASLPGTYGPPRGALLLAPGLGCVGVHPLDGTVAEMKRLFVRPAARGTGLGRALALAACDAARSRGFTRLRLDTIASSMGAALSLYRSLGFGEIPPYRENPIVSALYLERLL